MAPSGVTFGPFLDAVGLPGALWAGPGRLKGRQSLEQNPKKPAPQVTGEPDLAQRVPIGPGCGPEGSPNGCLDAKMALKSRFFVKFPLFLFLFPSVFVVEFYDVISIDPVRCFLAS